jgi:hypothetical protein
MGSLNHGRYFFEEIALSGHGRGAFPRQSKHRVIDHRHLSGSWHQGLAPASGTPGQAGFRFSKRAARGVCGRMLLARLPQPPADAGFQRALLEREDSAQYGPGSQGECGSPPDGLDGGSDLGACAFGPKASRRAIVAPARKAPAHGAVNVSSPEHLSVPLNPRLETG